MRKISVGDSSEYSKTITESDVYNFADIVGDYNPIHISEMAGNNSIFKKRVAQGMLVGSLISTVLGTRLPGEGCIYLEQNLKFLKPVFFGDTVTAKVEVSEIINKEKGIYRMKTCVFNQDNEMTHDGYAVVKYL